MQDMDRMPVKNVKEVCACVHVSTHACTHACVCGDWIVEFENLVESHKN